MTQLKILLLNPPFPKTVIRDNYCCFTSKTGYLWPPVDLLYLSGSLHHPQIELHIIDAIAQKLSSLQTADQIALYNPDITICLTGTATYPSDMLFLDKLSLQLHLTKIFLIGNTPAFESQLFLKKYPFVTGVIHNFFEPGLARFFLDPKRKPPSTVSYRSNDHLIIGKVNLPKKLSTVKLHHPPQYHLFPINKYQTPTARNHPFTTVLTSFGCPHHCLFCVAGALDYHQRDLNDLRSEFDEIKNDHIPEIFFEDSTFNADPTYLTKICQLLIKEKYNFSWSTNIHSLNLTPELASLMKKAGCHTVQIGVESGNQSTLDRFAPSKNIDTIKQTFNICRQHHLKTLGYFIIGFPGESQLQAKETISLAKNLDPDLVSFSSLTPDYGTKLHELRKDHRLHSFDSSDQNQMIRRAYFSFYLRPTKIWQLFSDTRRLPMFMKNGLTLIQQLIFS